MDDKNNLIYNGDFRNGTDDWSLNNVFVYSPSINHNYSYGGIIASGSSDAWRILKDKYIQIDTSCTYTFSADIKLISSANSYCYSSIEEYDKYGNEVLISEINHVGDTTLAAQLKNGDTAATVTSNASSFYGTSGTFYLGICDSAAYGYNRCIAKQQIINTAVNTTTMVVPFKDAWTGGTWAAGTRVARFSAGANHVYPFTFNKGPVGQWKKYSGDVRQNNLHRHSAVMCKIGMSKNANWKYEITNFRFENKTKTQIREYEGSAASSERVTAEVGKNAIAICSSADEISTMPVRYIRDWCNGSNSNAANHWCEIQAWDKYGRNVAFASKVSGYTSTGELKTLYYQGTTPNNGNTNSIVEKGHLITKGSPSPVGQYLDGATGLTCAMIDMGQIFDVEKIIVWHYWSGGRKYVNTKTEVSTDRKNWTTVFDSATQGQYAETQAGHEIILNERTASVTNSGKYKANTIYEI